MVYRRLIRLLLCLPGVALPVLAAGAQPVHPEAAARLRQRLVAPRADTIRVNLLLQLGAYHLYKPLELRAEKESLLREIHHRVKNNLQVVVSLLSSQAATLQDEKALSAIQESQHRVYTMALIHQKLYQSEGLVRIPMREYIAEAVAYLHDAYCPSGPVRFHLSVDAIELDVAQAVPLGLILNEAVTNALKYAFPGGSAGTVHVSLRRLRNGAFTLTIAEDGVGLPAGYDPTRSRSLGMKLLQGFSRQLGGRLRIGSYPGTRIRLTFGEERASSVLSPTTLAG